MSVGRVPFHNNDSSYPQHNFPSDIMGAAGHMARTARINNKKQQDTVMFRGVKSLDDVTSKTSPITGLSNQRNMSCVKHVEKKESVRRKKRPEPKTSHCADMTVMKRHVNGNTTSTWHSHPHFPRIITKEEYDSYVKLVSDVSRLFESNNITLVMAGRTLLGSYIFHDMIPWDDHISLWMPYQDVPKVKKLFNDETLRKTLQICAWGPVSISNEYDYNILSTFPYNAPAELYYRVSPNDIDTFSNHFFKLFYSLSKTTTNYKWKWPFLDIAVFDEDRDHIRFCEQGLQLPWNEFYPLIKRPLGSNMLMAPRDTRYVLLQQFRNFRCISSSYSHRLEMRTCQKIRIECQKLWRHYPQVWGEPKSYGQLETLMLGNKTLQVFEYRNKGYESRRPYNIWMMERLITPHQSSYTWMGYTGFSGHHVPCST